MADYILRNDKAKVMTMDSDLNLVMRYLKHGCPDGDYSVEGPDTDATYYRINGIVYPSGGIIAGEKLPPRSRQECIEFYGEVMDQECKEADEENEGFSDD